MRPIYLSKVLISNFRTYGLQTEVPIEPNPGLTILCGMNGLGKTSFFEAIEWALTGNVRRLHCNLDRVLSRLGTPPGSHAVELQFDNGGIIKRTRTEAPRHDDLVSLLHDDGWQPEIRDIGTYLRLTHFLSQTSDQRFLKQEDKWQLLKGPAGVDRLEQYRALLNDGKARNAFRRSIAELERKRDDAIANLAQFQSALRRQRELQAIASAEAALPPQQVEGEIEEMVTGLREIGSAPDFTVLSSQSISEKLSALTSSIEDHLVKFQRRTEILATAEIALAKWNEMRTNIAGAETRVNNLETELAARRIALEQAHNPVVSSRNEIGRLELENRAYKDHAEVLRRFMEARQTIELLEPQLRALEPKLGELGVSLTNIEARRQQLEELSQKRADLLRTSAGLRDSQASLDAAMALYDRAIESKRIADEIGDDRASWAEKQSRSQQLKQSSAAVITEAERTIVALRSRIQASQDADDAIDKAVAEIAIRLTEGDTTCPVCKHSHGPGELVRKARESMEQMRGGSAILANELTAVQAQLAAAREIHEEAARNEAEAAVKIRDVESAFRNADQLRAVVEADPYFAGVAFSNAAASIMTKRAELRVRSEAITRQLANILAPDVLSSQQIENTTTKTALKSQIEALEAQRGAWNQQLDQCRAVIASTIGEVGDAVIDLEDARAQVLRKVEDLVPVLENARITMSTAERSERVAQENLTNTEANVSAANRELADLTNAGTVIVNTWKNCGFVVEPSAAELERSRSELSACQTAMLRLRERHRTIVQGFKLWAQNEELRRIDGEVSRMMTGAETTELAVIERRFTEGVQQAEVELDHAKAAFARAEEICGVLVQKSEEFSNASLQPLTARIAAFNDIISPFGYGYCLDAKLSPTRGTKALQTISMPNPRTGQSIHGDPESYLSEGQTSALGLSVLFGANMEYRWSRWPALLLDDPLQNTDLIHSAAFIDVIRGLMLDRGFQIIVSTHDMDEADFIARKCQRSKLAVTRVELLSFGPDGLRTKTRTI
ncbi:MAG: AAA family ATPase [Chthoniobacteraceae bacterium]